MRCKVIIQAKKGILERQKIVNMIERKKVRRQDIKKMEWKEGRNGKWLGGLVVQFMPIQERWEKGKYLGTRGLPLGSSGVLYFIAGRNPRRLDKYSLPWSFLGLAFTGKLHQDLLPWQGRD